MELNFSVNECKTPFSQEQPMRSLHFVELFIKGNCPQNTFIIFIDKIKNHHKYTVVYKFILKKYYEKTFVIPLIEILFLSCTASSPLLYFIIIIIPLPLVPIDVILPMPLIGS